VAGGQVIERVTAAVKEVTGTGADLATLLGQLAADGFRPNEGDEIELAAGDDGVALHFGAGPARRVSAAGASILAEAWAQAGAHHRDPLTIRAQRRGWQRVLVHVGDVPGFGWAAWEPAALTVAPVTVADATTFGNGMISVTVDPADGTWSVTPRGDTAHPGLGRLVDDGDGGDTYNYSPPAADRVIDRPERVSVEVVERGPVRGVVRITASYRWPHRRAGGERVGEPEIAVTTDLEVRAGEDVVRVTTAFDNRCRDHRVRAWFPLPVAAAGSRAECAFATVERGLVAEGGPHEYPLPTFPSRRFVSAGGLTLFHEGLLEYEVVTGGTALALTLLRATGILSQPVMAYRDNAAGPALPLEGPQMQGPLTVRYAVGFDDGNPYAISDQLWVPLEVVEGSGGGGPGRGQVLEVSGAEVSAVQRVGGRLEVRVFNPQDGETTVDFGHRAGWLVDLRGAPLERFEGSFPLRAWGIATVQLDEEPS
jgi:hypothetical protein